MRVRDIMTSSVYVVRHDAPVEDAAELMTTYAVTALPVVDGDERLVGMVSDSDLLWHRVPAELTTDPGHHPDTGVDQERRLGVVVEAMSEYPVTITPGADVADAAQLMLDHDVRSLPVLQDHRIVGILSRRDILKAMVRDDSVLTADVQQRLDDYAGSHNRWTATVEAGVATVEGQFPNEQQRTVVTVLTRTVPGVAAVRLIDDDDGDSPNDAVTDAVSGDKAVAGRSSGE
ncbi:CBS domain-containing protein [Actinoplanes xinjiangensis]|uniref:BON domain-containing protein n=1 Tax=Actinoplanes xinjiangensis TaxID=512350 RepID=A0A316E9Z3_9ACTN|nr:CBS domain-containing protein [Actinoplanes xinjiangensis]PWK26809.1 BON domain-containing protein [Actinoplanes xinjiangensis]GIF45372.1 CBS domain-containing protein [Actinoplanes xinjiangensis]